MLIAFSKYNGGLSEEEEKRLLTFGTTDTETSTPSEQHQLGIVHLADLAFQAREKERSSDSSIFD